jgi:hypothetical protein
MFQQIEDNTVLSIIVEFKLKAHEQLLDHQLESDVQDPKEDNVRLILSLSQDILVESVLKINTYMSTYSIVGKNVNVLVELDKFSALFCSAFEVADEDFLEEID